MQKISILTLLFFFGVAAGAQDIHLSQFYETPLMRNPALAGIFTGDVRVQGVYRNQWQAISYPYTTRAISAEYKFGLGQTDDYLTIDLQTFHDVAGITRLNTVQVMPGINFHKSLDRERNRYLSLGFMGGFVQRYFSDAHLTFDNQYTNGRFNPAAPTGENFSTLRRSFADYAAGLSYNSSLGENGNYFLGAALYHLSKPVETFMQNSITLRHKVQVNAGVRMPVSEYVEFRGEANYLRQGAYQELIAGGLLTYYVTDMSEAQTSLRTVSLSGGAFVRLNDAVIPVIKLNWGNMEAGLSYDANVSKLSTASQGRGGYEFSLSYRGFLNSVNSTLDKVLCPRF